MGRPELPALPGVFPQGISAAGQAARARGGNAPCAEGASVAWPRTLVLGGSTPAPAVCRPGCRDAIQSRFPSQAHAASMGLPIKGGTHGLPARGTGSPPASPSVRM